MHKNDTHFMLEIVCHSKEVTIKIQTFLTTFSPFVYCFKQVTMQAAGYQQSNFVLFTLTSMVMLEVCRVQGCRTGSWSECEKAPFVPGHNLAGEGFDVVRMRRTGAYVINVKGHTADNHTCTLCPNRFQQGQVKTVKLVLLHVFPSFVFCHNSFDCFLPPPASHSTSCLFSPPPQIQKLPAAVLDWRPFSRCSKQLSSALHHSVDSLLRSSNSLVNNNWGLGLSLENIGNGVLGGSRSDLAKFARSQHSVDKATFAIHEISCTYYR